MSVAEKNQTYTHKRRDTYVVVEIVNDLQVYYRIKFTKRRRWIDRARFEREWVSTVDQHAEEGVKVDGLHQALTPSS